MSKLRPLGDRVLVRPVAAEVTTKSGIVLPESAAEKPNQAEVIAVGAGKLVDGKRVALEVKVGDIVVYKESWGSKIKLEGVEYELLEEENILAVLEK
jgi:chaperonin GroES